MAAQDIVGKFVPSDEQLCRAVVRRSEFAFFAAKVRYWEIRGSFHVGDGLAEGYSRLVEAIEKGDSAVADQIFRRWGVRRAPVEASLPRSSVRFSDLPTGENFEASPVESSGLGRLL